MQQRNMYQDLGYLAGLIDGEGCINAYWDGKNTSPRIRISIVNTDKKMVEWVKERYGGYIHQRKFRQKNWKDCFTWIINPSRKDKNLIKSLISILITKKAQMNLALEYVLSLNNDGEKTTDEVKKRREQIYRELKQLNSGSDND